MFYIFLERTGFQNLASKVAKLSMSLMYIINITIIFLKCKPLSKHNFLGVIQIATKLNKNFTT